METLESLASKISKGYKITVESAEQHEWAYVPYPSAGERTTQVRKGIRGRIIRIGTETDLEVSKDLPDVDYIIQLGETEEAEALWKELELSVTTPPYPTNRVEIAWEDGKTVVYESPESSHGEVTSHQPPREIKVVAIDKHRAQQSLF